MSNSFKPRTQVGALLVYLAVVAFAVLVVFFGANKAHAEDVHMCTGISQNAAILYRAFEQHGAEAAEEIAQEVIQSDLNDGQKYILLQGTFFLQANWGHPSLNLKLFQQAAREICEANFGQIADRNNV